MLPHRPGRAAKRVPPLLRVFDRAAVGLGLCGRDRLARHRFLQRRSSHNWSSSRCRPGRSTACCRSRLRKSAFPSGLMTIHVGRVGGVHIRGRPFRSDRAAARSDFIFQSANLLVRFLRRQVALFARGRGINRQPDDILAGELLSAAAACCRSCNAFARTGSRG